VPAALLAAHSALLTRVPDVLPPVVLVDEGVDEHAPRTNPVNKSTAAPPTNAWNVLLRIFLSPIVSVVR
jgi:hypothetical protein